MSKETDSDSEPQQLQYKVRASFVLCEAVWVTCLTMVLDMLASR
jgi:hypothetical protein